MTKSTTTLGTILPVPRKPRLPSLAPSAAAPAALPCRTKAIPSPPAALGPIVKRKNACSDVVAVSGRGAVMNADDASLTTGLVRRISELRASNALPL